MMKKNKNPKQPGWTIVSSVVMALLILSEGWALYRLWDLALLPGKLFAVLVVTLAAITALVGFVMFPRIGRHQKSRGILRRMIAYLLAIAIGVPSVLGGMALSKLDNTFDAITKPQTVSAYLGVYVRADDPVTDIHDVSGYTFAVSDSFNPADTEDALKALQELWGTEPLTRGYLSADAMIDALRSGEVDGILINEGFLPLLTEVEGYESYESEIKQIYQHCVLVPVEPTTVPTEPQMQADPSDPTAETEDPAYAPFIAYLSGSDTRSHMLAQSRSDVNILAVVNPETHQILLVNTPRDYFIPNPAYGNANDKLTHCGLNGTQNSAKALSQLYGIRVDYTAQINFTGFETLIDSIGGITIYAERGDGVFLSAGANYMDGERALAFARDRHDYAAGDNARGQHQMMVIKAVVDKLASGSIITNYSSILDSLSGMFVTSMPSERISELIKMQINDMSGWNIQSFAVTGTGGSDRPAAMGGHTYAYVMYPDKASVSQASTLIERVLKDEILTEHDVQPAA